jgi:cytoskeletal protein CcmA (bactofilin family)
MTQVMVPPMAMLGGKREAPANVSRLNPADADTILGPDAQFSGKLTFEGVVRIDGKFEGEIFTEDLLVISAKANVRATLNVGSIIINGTVEGDIHAKVSVELQAPAKVRGNIVTPSLVIEKGVMFDGSSKMTKDPRSVPPPPPPKS